MRLRTLPFILAALLVAQISGAQGSRKLYATMFSDPDGRVYTLNLDGTGLGWFGLPIRTKAIALDWSVAPHRLYIGLLPSSGTGKIIRCNTDGTNVQDVVTNASSVSDIELDLTNRKVYWTQNTWDDDRVYRADMDGVDGNITQIYATTVSNRDLWGLALDVRNHRLWVTERGGTCYDSYIRRMSMSGGSVTVVRYPVCNPHDIEYFDGKIYWGDRDGIEVANPDGTGIDTLVGPIANDGLAIDGTNNRVYWVTYGVPAIWRVDMDKNNRTVVSNILPTLSHIDIDYNPSAVSVAPRTPVPGAWDLAQNYPNPFNPVTTIAFSLPRRATVTLSVSNLLGQEVATLLRGEREAGTYEARFDATGLPSGVYFYRLKADGFTQSRTMLLTK